MARAKAIVGDVLTIDVSNMLTTIAVWRFQTAQHHFQISTDDRRTADEYIVCIGRLLEGAGVQPAALAGAAIACVVPALGGAITEACTRLLGRAPLVVGPGMRTGLVVRTDNPREVGADRIANAVAAIALFGAPVIIVDFATALSIDVVDGAAQYVGAIIAPGIEVSAAALARRTAQLGSIALVPPPSVIGDSTMHSLQSGLVFGHAAMVDGLVARVQASFGPAKVVATGESPSAADIVPLCSSIDAFEPLLTLDGLNRLFRATIEHPTSNRRSVA
ncbi:MAG: type III pantothenate kinase [Ardenticatenales bacterium]